MQTESVFLVSGERSGDLHALELLTAFEREVKDRFSFHGLGGSHLVGKYGDTFEDWVEEAAVIGITEVLKKYGWFKKKFAETLNRIEKLNPAAVVLVDYPGFNLRLAKALRKSGFKGKICYYISPQVWAWNQGRIPKMAKLLDLMMCVFEFEKNLYEDSGLKTEWVGHPMVEELEERKIETLRKPNLVGLFPGSRGREVKSLLPIMLVAAEKVSAQHPEVIFELAVASNKILEIVQELLKESGLDDRLTYKVGESHRLMQEAQVAWVASGTASLEAGFYGLPYALVYKVSTLTYGIAKMVVKIPYIGMVNILANKLIVKEFIQGEANADNIASEILKLLKDENYRGEMQSELLKVKDMLGGGGAHEKAARAIAMCINS